MDSLLTLCTRPRVAAMMARCLSCSIAAQKSGELIAISMLSDCRPDHVFLIASRGLAIEIGSAGFPACWTPMTPSGYLLKIFKVNTDLVPQWRR